MIIFDTLMSTPLGKRKGRLEATIENGKINGYLSMLGHTEPIDGTVDSDGNCTLSGRFVTLLNAVDFTANGTVRSNALRMCINGNGNIYELVGIPHEQEECGAK